MVELVEVGNGLFEVAKAFGSAFETAVQTTMGIGVGLFRLAFGAVVFVIVMGVAVVGCLMLLS